MSIFETKWAAPSNIALTKYWGKKEVQIPQNPSISLSLEQCKTVTLLKVSPKRTKDAKVQFEFSLDGQPKPDFHPKLEQFFQRALEMCPWLVSVKLEIDSKNSFPHGAGIASSASAYAALALCLSDYHQQREPIDFLPFASELARLGSGSACRSLYGGFALWGELEGFVGSSNQFAIAIKDHHPYFKGMRDLILLVDEEEKAVSSSLGHALLKKHPYAQARFGQAKQNNEDLLQVLANGDPEEFLKIVENEAFSLHSLMMSSNPSYILMKPNTLHLIQEIKEYRQTSNVDLFITLDAGPNVHLLYHEKDEESVMQLLQSKLIAYCHEGKYICDKMGNGPTKLD